MSLFEIMGKLYFNINTECMKVPLTPQN